jgi:hypothetical protein
MVLLYYAVYYNALYLEYMVFVTLVFANQYSILIDAFYVIIMCHNVLSSSFVIIM